MLLEDLITSTRTASHNIWGKISGILICLTLIATRDRVDSLYAIANLTTASVKAQLYRIPPIFLLAG